ncbi:bifunctional hydroxymethylpyrimidine kinase/phosphomethylpyrimidine kinase [Pasteurellaceae bacterium LIM206]|nr:bifunctional hydroxymethylpyrimidine kinase/phosphomethylpyrimidine kinase [Pasteurellaceae bacterium LIM206]
MRKIPQVLTIAGSDSGGGAGIQADLKTFQMRHVFGMSVITAVTAQNTLGVVDIHLIPNATVQAQLRAIAEDFSVAAVKIGMLGDQEIIETVAQALKQYRFKPIIVDPVMIAKSGAALMREHAVNAFKRHILPLANVITPNLPEATQLTGIQIRGEQDIRRAAAKLQEAGVQTVIIKGGHSEGSQSAVCCDWIFHGDEVSVLKSPRIRTAQTHGTGCTFSACLTAELAKGKNMRHAAETAKAFITAAIGDQLNIGHGHGPTNHWAYRDE